MINALRQLDKIDAKLKSLDAIDATMAKRDRQLLTLDTTGDRAKAAIAVGNVDTAKHIAVFTPGFTSTVDGSLKGYDNDMQNLNEHSQNISNRFGDGRSVAAVTWIGYEAPQTAHVLNPDKSVGSDNLAKIGAHKLDGFLNGLGASHDLQKQELHLTALGHSYGSLTTGIALQQATPVHDAVVFGSPGLDINQRSDLKVPEGHMLSEWSDRDPVPHLDIANNFGVSPYEGISGGTLSDINQLSTGDASHPGLVGSHCTRPTNTASTWTTTRPANTTCPVSSPGDQTSPSGTCNRGKSRPRPRRQDSRYPHHPGGAPQPSPLPR
jgi:hypothetical protein